LKAAPLEYLRPRSVDEAVRMLDEHLGMARVLAGGQSLVPMLHMRLLRPSAVVDVNRLGAEMGRIDARASEVVIGALVRYVELERSPVVAERLPILQQVVSYVGDPQVRNRGTLGGALAQSDPTGELPLACLALGARVVVRSVRGEREIPLDGFFAGSYANVLEPEELVVAVRFPPSPAHCAFFERGRKHNDFATVSVLALGTRDPAGRWSGVRVALGGVNDRPVLAAGTAETLEGRAWDAALIERAAQRALEVVDAPDDVRGSAAYREHLVPIHVRRVLADLERRAAT
jgi:aerobic carbon-monoxide dehydrogenase medium subunit